MKQLFYALLLSTVLMASTQQAKVFICNGSASTAYHKLKNCAGLAKCRSKVVQITETDAVKKYKRHKCGYCYK